MPDIALPLEISRADLERIRNSPLFDAEWYLKKYPDVAMLGMDPAEHYLKYGALLRRDPGPEFCTGFYLDTHPGRWQKTTNPLTRFHGKGRSEMAPESRMILWAAANVASTGEHAYAIALAEQYLPEDLAYTAHILRANTAIAQGREDDWLTHLNAYLDQFNVSPLVLKGEGTLFDRFATEPLPPVTGGPLVSVIMPAFNAERTIRAATRSILNQTWRNIELLIVDDASEDGTWTMMQEIAAGDSRVCIRRNKVNVGPYVSKNLALIEAKGDWITGHDADDWAHPQRLADQIHFLTSEQQPYALTSMLRLSEDASVTRLTKPNRNTSDGILAGSFITLMTARKLLKGIYGQWDDLRFGADSELIRRIEAVEKRPIPRIQKLGILAMSLSTGLTNHPEFGYRASQLSPVRTFNRDSAADWHEKIDKTSCFLPFPNVPRLYKAHPDSLNPPEKSAWVISEVHKRQNEHRRHADVCIVTNLRLPGGNTFSTIDEKRALEKARLNVELVHCPVDLNLRNDNAFDISPNFAPHSASITFWYDVLSINCRHLIIRHPRVITSAAFARLLPLIKAERTTFVINNSVHDLKGGSVYDMNVLKKVARTIQSKRYELAPISPRIRNELLNVFNDAEIAKTNWNPTFDADEYMMPVKRELTQPIVIGRHGRDNVEKWLEDPTQLALAYPERREFQVRILGGANYARKILGGLPSNWVVHSYGEASAAQYLRDIDVFVYFPHTQWREAFGRTIAEAMIAGRPVVLPPSFEETFGDLAFYCNPEEVERLVHKLQNNWESLIPLFKEVQRIAVSKFSSDSIRYRFEELFDYELRSVDNFADRNGLAALSEDCRSLKAKTLTIGTEAQ